MEKCFSAAVLAGGFSSRMGKDKAALPFHGMTMLEHQVHKLRQLGIRDIMISGSSIPVRDTRFVPDIYPHLGPLSGIHACLKAAKADSVLFLGVDVPLVPAETLRALLSAHGEGITVLQHGEKAEPLIGIYDSVLSQPCEHILPSEKTAVRRLWDFAPVFFFHSADPEILYTNCNTEEDYLRLCEVEIV